MAKVVWVAMVLVGLGLVLPACDAGRSLSENTSGEVVSPLVPDPTVAVLPSPTSRPQVAPTPESTATPDALSSPVIPVPDVNAPEARREQQSRDWSSAVCVEELSVVHDGRSWTRCQTEIAGFVRLSIDRVEAQPPVEGRPVRHESGTRFGLFDGELVAWWSSWASYQDNELEIPWSVVILLEDGEIVYEVANGHGPTEAPTWDPAALISDTWEASKPTFDELFPAAESNQIDLSDWLSSPLLTSDGSVVTRVNLDGTTDELFATSGPGQVLTEFASDGAGGVLLQLEDEFKENDFIAWLPADRAVSADDSVLEYPVVVELGLQARLVGAVLVDDQPHVLYQRIDSTRGALESVGTLRIRGLVSGFDFAIRETGAWETGTFFSPLSGPSLTGVFAADQLAQIQELDPSTGDIIRTAEVGCGEELVEPEVMGCFPLTDWVDSWSDGFVGLDTTFAEGTGSEMPWATTLWLASVDEGTRRPLSSIADHPRALPETLTVVDGVALIARSTADGRPLPLAFVDVATGATAVTDLEVDARIDRAETLASLPSPEGAVDGSETFGGVRIGASYDEVIALLGEPVSVETFEWHGGEGLTLTYPDAEITIHYDVSQISLTGVGACTGQSVCVGASFTDLERPYGFGWTQSTADPETTRRTIYPLAIDGYCQTTFEFGRDSDGVESVELIVAQCLPD